MFDVFYMRESVYSHLKKEEVPPPKPPRYMSKHRPAVLLEKKSNRDAMRTMGPAKIDVPCPEKFLKKHLNEPKLPGKTQCSKEPRHTCCAVRKPPIPAMPARRDKPPMDIRTKRDFIKPATVVPVKHQPTFVDTKKGHKQLLENSGLFPKYINKKDYGKIPEYLQQRKEEERRVQVEFDNLVKKQREEQAMKCVSAEEQGAVLVALKKKWDQQHHEFQGLPFVMDNLSKKTRRVRLEASLDQLEKKINFLERSKIIYIAKD